MKIVFVDLFLAATFFVCFLCTARYEEAKKISVGNITKPGLSMRVMIKKGKHNLEIKSQLAVIQLNSQEDVGNFYPVKILNTYLLRCRSIPGTLNSDPLFPKTQKVCLGFDLTEKVILSTPVVLHSYDSFCQD